MDSDGSVTDNVSRNTSIVDVSTSAERPSMAYNLDDTMTLLSQFDLNGRPV